MSHEMIAPAALAALPAATMSFTRVGVMSITRDVDHPGISHELQAEIDGNRGHQLNSSGDLRRHDLKGNGLLLQRRNRVH
jgi:hypothetical protein